MVYNSNFQITQTRDYVMIFIEGIHDVRIIPLDGRPHLPSNVRQLMGDPRGHWEGDTLVVDAVGFVDEHHWIDNGIPASDQLHIVERMRLTGGGAALEIEYTLSDPKNWVGEWKMTKRWKRVDDTDITEASCLPDLNAHMPSVTSTVTNIH